MNFKKLLIIVAIAIILTIGGSVALTPYCKGLATIVRWVGFTALFSITFITIAVSLKASFHNLHNARVGGFSVNDMFQCETLLSTEPYARYVGKDIRDSANDLGLAIEDTDEAIDIAKEVVRCLDGPYEKSEKEYAQRWKASWEEYMATALMMPYEDVEQAIREGKTVVELNKAYGLPESVVSRRVEDVKFLSEIRHQWR